MEQLIKEHLDLRIPGWNVSGCTTLEPLSREDLKDKLPYNAEYNTLRKAIADDDYRELRRLAKKGADLSNSDEHGYTLAHHAAWHGHDLCLLILAQYGAPLSNSDEHGYTPAHRATLEGATGSLKVLAKYGADFNVANEFGNTALYYVLEGSRCGYEGLQILIKNTKWEL